MISVHISTYNNERFIAETLKTLLHSQSDEIGEILIFNDGSTDNTLQIAKEFEYVDSRIHIINSQSSHRILKI
jgi:glycosyltransferase involved in cell wall biosynthesis